jgi:uncharacterized protein YdeI (YjbR/CyaY-like superfamily)
MKITKSLHIATRKEWRAWLKKNHALEQELWLVFYRKVTGKSLLDYDDAVEEALCFGWIDSTIKKIDDDTYARKFTPRKKGSKWSDTNIRRVQNLLRENIMEPAGLLHISPELLHRKPTQKPNISDNDIPPFILEAFSREPEVLQFFNSLAPSHRRNYVMWISAAKRDETRQKRIAESISLLMNKQKLGLK